MPRRDGSICGAFRLKHRVVPGRGRGSGDRARQPGGVFAATYNGVMVGAIRAGLTASPSRSGLPSRPSGHPIADPCPHVPQRTRCTTPQRPNGPVQPPNHSPLISPDNHPSQPPNCSTADPPLDRRRVPECGCPARRARPPSGPRGCHVMRLSTASALPSAWVARVGVSRLSTDAPACEDGTATLTSL